MDEITPKTNTELFGHEAAEQTLMQGLAEGKLAHGWIIGGPRGIGKATLAYRFARALLGNDENTAHRIATGAHADFLVIEQVWDEKKEQFKNEISVEQAREIGQFLSLTAGEGQWRVVIIDSADALNTQAANAILKILEEPPPQAILLLIAHHPGRLLPTIRSRCRSLRLQPLSDADFRKTMRHISPGIDNDEIKLFAQLSDCSPGIALALKEQGAGAIYEQLLVLLENPLELDTGAIHRFADQLGSGKVHENWHLFSRLVLFLLEGLAKESLSSMPSPLASLHPAHIWAEKWQQASDQFSLAERLHLDYKQVIITFFHSIAGREPFQIGNAA